MSAPHAPEPASRSSLWWLLMPLALLLAGLAWIFLAEPLKNFEFGAPPVENLTVERTILDDDGIRLLLRAGGSEPMSIAQAQIDAAYWEFTQDPPGKISRGSAVWLQIPFPWMPGEAHLITLVTNTGATFEHAIDVAVATPKPSAGQLRQQALVGLFVGVFPIVLGLMFYPVLRNVRQNGMNFLLALTVGLLVFLLIDTLEEAFDLAARSAAVFQGPVMVLLAALSSFLVLMAVSHRKSAPTGLALSTFISLGIGLHNFGEGLAIGAAFAAGSAGLGTFLILGFTLHNVTEGIGIAAPILRKRPPLWVFAALAALAGAPAVLGMWMGSLAFAAQWAALALAIGAGAILQVVVQVCAYLMRLNSAGLETLYTRHVLAGGFAGLAFMYATAALIKI